MSVPIECITELYAQGKTLKAIGTELGLTQEGVRGRLVRAGVARRPRSIARTHCKRGHPLTPDNLIIYKSTGARGCKECTYALRRERYRIDPEFREKTLLHLQSLKDDPRYLEAARRNARAIQAREKKAAAEKRRIALSPRSALSHALHNALKRHPTERPATTDDLMALFKRQEGRCALSGITMTWNKGGILPTSISIDRIDLERGYAPDNIRLLCFSVNAFRGRMNDGEMLEMARAIVNHTAKPLELPRLP
jgi:hypothetical protein